MESDEVGIDTLIYLHQLESSLQDALNEVQAHLPDGLQVIGGYVNDGRVTSVNVINQDDGSIITIRR